MEGLIVLVALCALAFVFIAPILALLRTGSIGGKVERLEQAVGELRRALHLLQDRVGAMPAQEQARAPDEQPQPEPGPPEETFGDRIEGLRPPTVPPTPTIPPPIVQPPAPQRPARTRAEWEELIVSWFSRIGAVALVFGAAYFLKVAFDRNWIGPWLRVVIGVAFGSGLVLLGVSFHRKDSRVFAQGLLGAGISILYLTSYACFNLYHLVTQPVALAMMSAVTVTAVWVALMCDALAVSLLGLVGGFLTPLLLSSNSGGGAANGIGLFAYIALLDAGLLMLAVKKDSWAVIEPLALLGTFLTYLVWHIEYYAPADLSFTIPFLVVFWGIFYAVDVYHAVGPGTTYPEMRMAVGAFNSVFFYIALYADISHQHPHWMGLATLLVGSAYFVTLLAMLRSQAVNPTVVARYVLTAISLLVIATAVQYSGFARALLWALEAAALVWCGLRWRMSVTWVPALCLFAFAGFQLLGTDNAFGYEMVRAFRPVLNVRFAAFAILAGSLGLSAVLLRRSGEGAGVSIGLSSVLHYSWCILVFGALTIELNDCFRKLAEVQPLGMAGIGYGSAKILVMAIAWMLYSIPLAWFGFRKHVDPILHSGFAVLVLAVGFLAGEAVQFEPIRNFSLLLNFRSAMVVAGMLFLLCHRSWFWVYRSEHSWIPTLLEVLGVGIALLGLELISVEAVDYFRRAESQGVILLLGLIAPGLARDLTLAVIWSVYSIPLVWYGFRKKSDSLLLLGFGALVLGIGVMAARGFSYAPAASFTLVWNPRFAAFAMAALAMLVHRRLLGSYRGQYGWIGGALATYYVVSGILIFELVTAETWDVFGKAIVLAPLAVHQLSNLRQMTLSLVWVLYSVVLMGFGIGRRVVALRFVSIALFAITILKVFLSDLSFLDTVYRVFSFIALGLILLGTKYLYERYSAYIVDADGVGKGGTVRQRP
jgi:uncharacterized membrane protein